MTDKNGRLWETNSGIYHYITSLVISPVLLVQPRIFRILYLYCFYSLSWCSWKEKLERSLSSKVLCNIIYVGMNFTIFQSTCGPILLLGTPVWGLVSKPDGNKIIFVLSFRWFAFDLSPIIRELIGHLVRVSTSEMPFSGDADIR